MINFLIIFMSIFMFGLSDVNAQSYTNTTNLFDGSISSSLLDIALVKDKDFLDKNYIIFQNDYNYYMMIFDDYEYKNNLLSIKDSFIIRYYREGNYGSTYMYQTYKETNTTFTPSYIYISNLDLDNSSGSSTFESLKNNEAIIGLLMLVVALIFAGFLLKERSSY